MSLPYKSEQKPPFPLPRSLAPSLPPSSALLTAWDRRSLMRVSKSPTSCPSRLRPAVVAILFCSACLSLAVAAGCVKVHEEEAGGHACGQSGLHAGVRVLLSFLLAHP